MIVIILNGYPESGKDEFILAAQKKYKCHHHSTIDVCKGICKHLGWDGVKDDKSRAMLVDLKKWYIKYLDGVFTDFAETVKWSVDPRYYDIFFVVSREGAEINRLRQWCSKYGYECVYIFMERGTERDYGNESDNNVLDGAEPDIFFDNSGTLEDLETTSEILLSGILSGPK